MCVVQVLWVRARAVGIRLWILGFGYGSTHHSSITSDLRTKTKNKHVPMLYKNDNNHCSD